MQPITYKFEDLVAHKESGNVPPQLLEKLKANADEIITKPTATVTSIKLPRPSGDAHDYVSISPYRWPNPDTPDGLPWVRRDGCVNKDTRTGIHPGGVYSMISTLALASFYFPERAEAYAEYANRQMYDWFINPETKINPNAKYAQSIPGVCDGTCSGIIEFCTCTTLHDAVGVLDTMGLMNPEVKAGVINWFSAFTDWLRSDEQGVREGNGYDNHGVWYDAQILSAAVFCGRTHLARSICQSSYDRRIRALVMPDGSQPAELRRATPISYSIYSLSAMLIVANIAEGLGFDKYWSADAERGECIIKSAVDFIYPYVKDPKSSPYPDLKPGAAGPSCARVLMSVAKRFPDGGYAERSASLREGTEPSAWLLEPVK